MYFGKGIVMLFVHFLYYLCSLLSGSLFFVSFFYFITDKPLRHFLFDDRGKGMYSNRAKYVDVFLRLFQGFSVLYLPVWRAGSLVLSSYYGLTSLPAYQLIIPGTVAFFWFLLSSGALPSGLPVCQSSAGRLHIVVLLYYYKLHIPHHISSSPHP